MKILKKDRVSKIYFEDKARFADLLNGFVFHGKAVLQADNIHERKREVTFPEGNKKKKYIEVTRDIVNEVKVQATVVMAAIENQSDIHYAMPVRVMAGDCGTYYEQWKKTAQLHSEQKDLTGAEFLSGFSKEDRLVPSITIVIYLGEEPWDGPRTLKDMFELEKLPEELQEYVADYPMYLLEVRDYKELENFRTDIQHVFGCLQYASDEEKLGQYIKDNQEAFAHLREDAFDFITQVSHSKELKELKKKYENPKGEIDMCKAIQDMIASGRKEGMRNGFLLAAKYLKKREEGKNDEEIARECECSIEDVKLFFSAMA